MMMKKMLMACGRKKKAEYVGGIAQGYEGTASDISIDISSLDIRQDDIIVCGFNMYDYEGKSLSASDFIKVDDVRVSTDFPEALYVGYKIADGSENYITIPGGTGNTSSAGAASVQVFRGIDTSVVMDVSHTTKTFTSSHIPNPPPIATVTDGAIIVAVGGGALGGGETTDTYSSSDLLGFVTSCGKDYYDSMIGAGHQVIEIASQFDPAPWTSTATDSSDFSAAVVVLALRAA